jgi:NAD(P)-dependent dehydrogenase (short-subunit alcohol dehydrogenase family)
MKWCAAAIACFVDMVWRIIADHMPVERALSGKTAIVTGAGTGIGRAIACELAAAGAGLELVGRRGDRLRETLQMIGGESDSHAHALDITDAQAMTEMIRGIVDRAGPERIDVLVNAAGVSTVTDLTAPDHSSFVSVIETNLTAAFDLVRLALPHIPGGGRIVNIASVLGLRAAPQSAAYCASKHGVIGLTRALALDLAPRRITVNAVCPGWVDTDMSRDIIAVMARRAGQSEVQSRAAIERSIPLGRMVEPREVAHLVAFLCTPAAGAITGQAIAICAGSSIS